MNQRTRFVVRHAVQRDLGRIRRSDKDFLAALFTPLILHDPIDANLSALEIRRFGVGSHCETLCP